MAYLKRPPRGEIRRVVHAPEFLGLTNIRRPQRMRRPHWRSAMFTAASGALGLAILAGCTTQQAGYNAYEQSTQYLRNARGTYRIPGPPGDPWGPYIREASTKFDIPEPWIRGLMHQESGGQLYQS